MSVGGVLLAKTLGASRLASRRFGRTSAELVDLELRSALAGRWRMATMSIVFAAIPALIYLAAGFPATSGGMTIGTLVAFTSLQAGIFRPLMALLNVGVSWVSSMALESKPAESVKAARASHNRTMSGASKFLLAEQRTPKIKMKFLEPLCRSHHMSASPFTYFLPLHWWWYQ